MDKKTLSVSAISHGTVIDHVPAGLALKIVKLFNFGDHQMTIGFNLPSNSMGRKDLIKIENIQLDHSDAARIAVFAPQASVNIIADFSVKDKFKVTVPEKVKGIVLCPNSNCISRSEPVPSHFHIVHRSDKVMLTCHFCERTYTQDTLMRV